MSKIHEEVIIIKLSKLIKDTADTPLLADANFQNNLEDVIQQLVESGVVVEIESAA